MRKWSFEKKTHHENFNRRFNDKRRVRDKVIKKEKLEPKPDASGKCSPLCPLFWCSRRAYRIKRDFNSGRKYVFCEWIGDECIGASCQYASCKGNYMLPDGYCAWVKQKASARSMDIFDELEREELDEKTRGVIAKKVGKHGLEDFY